MKKINRLEIFIFALLIFLISQPQAFAQDISGYSDAELISYSNGNPVLGLGIKSDKNLEGSSFYNDEWLPGIVLIKENQKSHQVQLRYDPYRKLVFFKENEKILALNNKYVSGFIIDKNDERKFFKNGFKADNNNIDRYTFLRVIYDGSVKLLVHHRTYLRKSHTNPFTSGKVSHEFRHKEDHYLKTADSEKLYEIKLRDKDLFEHIDEKYHNRLEEYAEENDLDFGEEKGFANILAYYEQLQKQNK